MSDSYTLAALRGFGADGDDSYTSAALRGFGDESYTGAALRGMGRLKACKTKGGKKLKGGVALSTIVTALGLIPPAVRGARAIYKWIKGSGILKSKKSKGGRALILNSSDRDDYIQSILEHFSGRRLASHWPYTLEKARKHATIRERRMGPEIAAYLKDIGLYDKAIFDTASMKTHVKKAREALKFFKKPKRKNLDTPKTKAPPKTKASRRLSLASLGLPDGKI